MKKKLKKLCCILVVFVLCFSIPVPVMAASAKYNAAVSCYKKYIGKNSGTYRIIDLDSNGIPELVMHNKSNYCNEVFTYNTSTRKMKCLKSIGMGKGYNMRVQYSKGKHQVVLPTASTGGSIIYIYTVKGQKISKVLEAEYINGRFERFGSEYRLGYKINGKRVSLSTYNKKLAAATKGFQSLGI